MKKLILVVGARPNFVKVARLIPELKKYFKVLVYHTGQHFDKNMSGWFLKAFQINIDRIEKLEDVKWGERFGQIMHLFQKYCEREKPDGVIVVGDVDSTSACAQAIKRLDRDIPLVHIESGLRSFDKKMPEEINRIITDHLSNIKFVTDPIGIKHLLTEGICKNNVDTFWVGNTMIDTLRHYEEQIKSVNKPVIHVLVTLHRPDNVDSDRIYDILSTIQENVCNLGYHVGFPVHPRVRKKIDFSRFLGIDNYAPFDYFTLQKALKCCHFCITDSGGIQEEARFWRKPLITIRQKTERPVTCFDNTNIVVWKIKDIESAIKSILDKGNIYKDLLLKKEERSYYKSYEVLDREKFRWKNNASKEITEILKGQL